MYYSSQSKIQKRIFWRTRTKVIISESAPKENKNIKSYKIRLKSKYFRNKIRLHWENFIPISFQIEWDMIVVTVFL